MNKKIICHPSTKFYIYNLDVVDMVSLKNFIQIRNICVYGTKSKFLPKRNDVFFIYEKGKNSGFHKIVEVESISDNISDDKYNIYNDKNKNVQYIRPLNTIELHYQIKFLQILEQMKKNSEFKSVSSFCHRFVKQSTEFIEISHKLGKSLFSTLNQQNNTNINNDVVVVKKKIKRKEINKLIISDDESNDESNTESDDESNDESKTESDNESKTESKTESDNESKTESDDESDNESKTESDNELDDESKTESDNELDDESKTESDDESDDDEFSDDSYNIPVLFDPCKKFLKMHTTKNFKELLINHVFKCKKCKITNNNRKEIFNKYVVKDCDIIMHDNNTNFAEIKQKYHELKSYCVTIKYKSKNNFIMDIIYVPYDDIYKKCYFLCIHEKKIKL